MRSIYEQRVRFRRESGAVLLVGLVMVLLISIVALSAIRSSNLQEAMAGNMRNQNLAFQAAESALVVGEAEVNISVAAPKCNDLPTSTTCYLRISQLAQNSIIFLSDSAFDNMDRDSGVVLAGIAERPTFLIEELAVFTPAEGSGLEVGGGGNLTALAPYRITAKGTGLGDSSMAIVQSTYNRYANSD